MSDQENSSDSEGTKAEKREIRRENAQKRRAKKANRAVPKMPKNKLLVIKNAEKDSGNWYESWKTPKNRSLANFPHPYRMIASGSVGRGKTNTIKNIFLSAQSGRKPFKKLYIVTCSLQCSEWDDCEPTQLTTTLPDPDIFDGKTKSLLILDDYEYSRTNKAEERKLATLFRYTSTHRNLSIITSYQVFFSIPSVARKCANIFLLYKPRSKQDLTMIANRIGMEIDDIQEIFKNICNKRFDSLLIDHTPDTPAPLRKNIFQKIEMAGSDSDSD